MTSLPRRRKPKPMGLSESGVIRCRQHLQWIRGHECAVQSSFCDGRVEAAHVRIETDGGLSMKPGDNWTIPLCSGHHRAQHRIGETSFQVKHRINMKSIAEQLWAKSPHGKRWRESQKP